MADAWVQDDSLKGLSNTITYKYEQHSAVKHKGLPWLVCKHCGLLYLRNKFTDWAIRMGCRNRWHPGRFSFQGRARA